MYYLYDLKHESEKQITRKIQIRVGSQNYGEQKQEHENPSYGDLYTCHS